MSKAVSQAPRNVSNNWSVRSFSNWFLQLKGGGEGGTKLSGKANFLLHLIMIHLVTEILEMPVSEEADVKVMQFHSTPGRVT